jgi:hypothetical protein
MSRFFIGFLLGALVGIAGTAAFLIVYGGGDYLVSTSPRVRELEATLSRADEDRDWLKARLREATEVTHRLESRFEGLAARFERLNAASIAAEPTPAAAPGGDAAAALPSPDPTPDASAASETPSVSDDAESADAAPTSALEAIPTIAPADAPPPG